MAQDIRELFRNDKGIPKSTLTDGHQKRFEAKLNAHFGKPEKQAPAHYMWLKIAAVFIVLLSATGVLLTKNWSADSTKSTTNEVAATDVEKPDVQLSDFSPQFKKVEDYYLASINLELAQLQVNDVNKDLVDTFMSQMEELNTEYKKLNEDLVDIGINDQTVTALIDNLKLRLDLLLKLKQKMKEIKQGQQNEAGSNRV